MNFGNFLFPDCRDPVRDGIVIDETLREAWLSDELGVDVIWLAEHHFDGICAYVDPISFAGALATSTRCSKIGFAVVQTALHHPIRLAEQLAILDNITKGRLIVGLGRGSSYNIYDYQGFGIDHHEAQERLEEAEKILVTAWTGEGFTHRGKFWDLDVPMLRPRPYTKPHPAIIRAASGEASMLELARQGRPFLMNVQSMAVTRQRVELYRRAMREAGYGEDRIACNLAECWVWRNVFVAETEAEAERVGVPVFRAMVESRAALRNRIFRETGMRIAVPESDLPRPARRSSTALSTGRPPGSPRPWPTSTRSASAASLAPSALDRCRTRLRPTASGCS
jgi:alkanesulfonate monooxygenase SsuD/methylene tetrahydromethanopterin reductase-like flavin-dependent oxidoreductase (luciferase family)